MGKLTYRTFAGRKATAKGAVRMASRLMCFAALGLVINMPAHAQSAANFNNRPSATKPAPSKKDKEQTAQSGKEPVTTGKSAATVSSTPSRYVGEADLAAYVESLSAVFSMRTRATDPFGQYQDPDRPVAPKPTAKDPKPKPKSYTATPFSEIVRLIKVTTIMPGEKRFLLADRSFKQGELLPILFRGRNINAQIVSVGSRQIDFRNMETGETASLRMELLPLGMTPGTKGISAPGMVPARQNTPIELEPYGATTSENSSQNP